MNTVVASQQNKRLLSLDILRGITIAGMILVNNSGSWEYVYAPLRHASWHGLTPTDLVFRCCRLCICFKPLQHIFIAFCFCHYNST